MREWLNGILGFIGASSLTDDEYNSINFLDLEVLTYNQAAYDQLSNVLEERESVSSLQEKLVAFFKAKGTDVAAADTGKTNIFLGAGL